MVSAGIAAELLALGPNCKAHQRFDRKAIMSSATNEETLVNGKRQLPLAGLLALFAAGFLGIINETIPAGLLPAMSKSLGLSESAVGQTITVYALATALTAIPLNAALKT